MPAGLAASATPTKAKPALGWTAATDTGGSGVVSYKVYRGATLAGTANGALFSDTALATDGSYQYRISAVDAAGNESAQSAALTVVYDKTAPPTPINLAGASPTRNAPVLDWDSGGSDNLTGLDHYEVYRGATLVSSVGGGTTAYTDTSLSSSGSQTYTVKAVDGAGNQSVASAPRVVIFDVVAPNAPTSTTLPPAVRVKPTVTWPAVTDTGGSGIAFYRVFRGGVAIGTATATSYTDNAVTTEGSYTYTVSAVDNAGNEGPAAPEKTTIYDVTAPSPPGAVSGTTPTKAKPTLNWAAATDPSGSGVATYTAYRNGSSIGTSVTTSFTDAALSINGNNAYTVMATDLAGNTSTLTAPVSIVYDTTAPPAPVGLTGVSPTADKPYMTWTDGGADVLSGLDRYDVYRGTTLVGSVPAGTTDFQDNSTLAAGTYQYTVKAVDHAGNASNASLSKSFTYDNVAPNAPANLAAASPTRLPILTWGAVTDTAGIARYDVYRDGVLAGSSASTTFTDNGVPADGPYTYTVRGIDNAGNIGAVSPSKLVVVDAVAPPMPINLTAPSPSATKPSLAWTTGGADNSSGFKHYQVYRNGVALATTTASGYVDASASVNGSFQYEVAAVDNAGNESAKAGPVTVDYDSTAPPVPTGVTGATPTRQAPAIAWFSGGPDNISGFSHYNVYRGTVKVNAAPVTATSFTDANLAVDGSYAYTVRAVDNAGNESVASVARTIIFDQTKPTVPAAVMVTTPTRLQPALTWTASTDGAASGIQRYDVYRDGALIGSTTGLAFTDTAVLSDDTYAYTVRAIDNAGNESLDSAPRSVLVDHIAPPPPNDVAGPAVSNLPTMSWTNTSDAGSGGSGVAGYNVYRNGVKIGTTVQPTYGDTAVSLDDSYNYTVTSVDAAGNESGPSSVLTVLFDDTPPPQPLSLAGATPSQSKPQLTWQSGGPDSLSGFAHYEVLRNGAVVDTTGGPPWSDTALAANGVYTYTVRAVDVAGNRSVASSPRTIVWDTTPPGRVAGLVAPTPTPRPALTWDAPGDTGGSGVAGYRIYRDGSQVATSTGAAYTDPDAIAEGTHTYTVAAIDAAGNLGEESDPFVLSVDFTLPSAPTALIGETPTRRPELSWGGSIDSGFLPSGVAGYNVYRGAVLAGFTSATTFTDLALTAQGTYLYTVRAVDRAGNLSDPSNGRTIAFDTAAPPTPANLTAPSPTASLPSLSWASGGADNLAGFDHYDILRDGTKIAESASPGFVDGFLGQQGPHSYTVRAVDKAGNISPVTATAVVVYDTTPPPAPTGFAVATPTRLPRLTWDAMADDDTGASGIDHYEVLRDGTLVGTSTTTSFDDGSVPSNGSYGYTVRAVDQAGNASLASRSRAVQVDATEPPAPTDVTGITPTKVPALGWQPVTDAMTGGSPIAGYRVYRDGLFVGEATTASYVDGKLQVSGQYVYTVRAVDAAGNVSGPSPGREIILDSEGPVLDGVSFPQRAIAGSAVEFNVRPRDVLSSIAGEASWDFGDGSAVGNSTKHVYDVPGRYTITIRATDALGNVTTVGDRSILVVEPKGGVPPKKLRLAKIPTMTLKVLSRLKWKLRASVTVDVDTNLQFLLMRGGVLVQSVSRKVPSGGIVIPVLVPKPQRKAGSFQLVVRSVAGDIQASQRFKLKKK